MPSSRSRSQQPSLTLARSFLKLVKSLFSSSQYLHQPQWNSDKAALLPRPISRPHQLRPSVLNADYPSCVHFIQRLPVEIISLIFVLGSEQDTNFPVTVSHVCSSWRYVALHTPALWRHIALGPQEDQLRARVLRARACSLDIQISPWRMTRLGFRRSQYWYAHSVYWHMQLVNPYIDRWRSLDIEFSNSEPYLWRASLAHCSTPAPALEELSLLYRNNDDTTPYILFAAYAPKLRRLTVDGISLAWMPSLYGNLTFLDYTHHGFTNGHHAVHDVLSILHITSQLNTLHILFPQGRIAYLPSRREPATQHVSLMKLKELVLKVDGHDIPFELASLVSLLSSPNLATLRLIDLGDAPYSFRSLKSFFYVYPIPRTLRYVHVGHAWYEPKMLQAMAQSLPLLSKITVKMSHTPEKVFTLNRRIRGHGPHYNVEGLGVQSGKK
ncbi:hypothetical protein CPC08DRAFT_683396 [Agrocybe pediades]|nr:hypothetical protein CPC08DRAFT_683396 [Agrocybe pediades]